jgi:hypothetical protein
VGEIKWRTHDLIRQSFTIEFNQALISIEATVSVKRVCTGYGYEVPGKILLQACSLPRGSPSAAVLLPQR